MRAILVLYCLAFYSNSFGQGPDEIVTDRPDITEASTVVPKGSLQLENGATWTSDQRQSAFDLTESLLRVGLTSRIELRFGAPNYSYNLDGPFGFSDLSLGFKRQIGPLAGGFDLSVIIAVNLPTGASTISSHGHDPFVKLPWSRELSGGWSIGGMQSVFWYTEDGRRNLTWEPTFYVERQLTKTWDVFVEYGGDYAQRGSPRQVAHFGTAYRLGLGQQIDLHVGIGASRAAPREFIGIGYSFRLDQLWGR